MAQYSAVFAGRAHNLVLTLTEGAKDVAAQKVTVSYLLEVVKGVNRQTWNNASPPGNQPWSITLGGTVVASGSSFRFNFDSSSHAVAPGTRFTIASGSYQVAYGTDGTLNLSVAFSADADVWSGGSHGSGTKVMGVAAYPSSGTVYFAPSSISVATQPTVTPKSAVAGATVTIGLPRTNPAFTHDLTWVSGTLSGAIATGVATTHSWVIPNVTGEFPTQVQSPIQITAVTKNGATVIGSKSVTLMEWNTAPSVNPVSAVPFDMRIRQVVWNGSRLKATTPIITTSLKLTDTASSTPTLTIGTSGVVPGGDDDLDGKLAVLEVQDGSSWISTSLLFVLSRSNQDDTDPTQAQSYSGTGFLDFELARGYLTADWKRTGSGTNAGSVIDYIVGNGRAKGWGPNIWVEFNPNANFTSVGDGWQTSGGTRELSGGTPYSQILESLVNDGWCEWRSRYDDTSGKCYLDAFNPGTGSDWTDSAAQVIVNFSNAKISTAPTTWSFEGVLDRVYAKGDSSTGSPSTSADNTPGIVASSERAPYDPDVFGYLEGWTAASGQTTTESIRSVAADTLDNATLTLSREFSYSAFAVSRNLLPYYTFKPGDWILIPSDRDKTADPISMRVTQIAVDKSEDGSITITVTCGDLIPANASASAIKKLRAKTGGSISGGTLKDPLPLQAVIPAAPDFAGENAATSTGYWDTHGNPRAFIEFSWLPVSVALDGITPVGVDYYEVWWRPNPSVEWVQKTFSLTTSVEMDNWAVDFTAQFKVRARTSAGVLGAFSAWDEVTTAEPTASIDPLAVALLYTDGLGTIFADWSGLLGSGSGLPAYFAYMNAEISPDDGTGSPTGVWTVKGNSLASTGTVTINPGDYGTWWVRFRAYDALGGPGIDGPPSSITTADPHIAPPTPTAPTSLVATPGAAWDASGFLPEAWFDLTWTAPTLDTDGSAVTIVGYDVYGLRSGETIERFLTSVANPAARILVGNGEVWTFRVTASSIYGGVSDFSSAVVATANATISVAAAPTAPTLTQYAGILQINWAGGGLVPQMKYAYAMISNGGAYTRVGGILNGIGEIDVPGLAPDNYTAKIVMVDELGQSSTSAASASITLLPITGVTFQTSELANTGIKITTGGMTAYDASGDPTFILNAGTGEVWIAPYAAVINLGASGTLATTGAATTGIAISAQSSSFNTFINPSGLQIRNDQTPLSWWEADATDGGLVNFFSPRINAGTRFRIGDYEMLKEAKSTGSRVAIRYKGL